MRSLLLFTFLLTGLFLTSCVSKKKYLETVGQSDFYKSENERLLKVQEEKIALQEKLRQTELDLRKTIGDLEAVTVRLESEQAARTDLLNRYNALLSDNSNLVAVSSAEKQNLEQQLAQKEALLDDKERELKGLEYILQERQQNLEKVTADLQIREQKVQELENLLSAKDQQMAALRSRVDQALRGFTAAELTVTERDGKIYVALSQNLLFKSGSDRIDSKGQQAIRQLAGALLNTPDVDILVEGHTDSDGSPSLNWDLSSDRAVEVVKLLTSNGVDPTRITAAGRALYAPVLPNTSAENKAANRRVDVILAPRLNALYELIQG